MISVKTVVLPVPGGPCITASSFVRSVLITASFCLLLSLSEKNLNNNSIEVDYLNELNCSVSFEVVNSGGLIPYSTLSNSMQ